MACLKIRPVSSRLKTSFISYSFNISGNSSIQFLTKILSTAAASPLKFFPTIPCLFFTLSSQPSEALKLLMPRLVASRLPNSINIGPVTDTPLPRQLNEAHHSIFDVFILRVDLYDLPFLEVIWYFALFVPELLDISLLLPLHPADGPFASSHLSGNRSFGQAFRGQHEDLRTLFEVKMWFG